MDHLSTSEKPPSHNSPTIGHASPQYARATRTIKPSESAGDLKSMVISCQSFVPVATAVETAIKRYSVGSIICTTGIPALFKFSLLAQKCRVYERPGSLATICHGFA